MTPKRLTKIVEKVLEKYLGEMQNPSTRQQIEKDIRAIFRGLHKTENFLDVVIDNNDIVFSNFEELPFMSFLPYLYPQLLNNGVTYFIFVEDHRVGHRRYIDAVKFEDSFEQDGCINVGKYTPSDNKVLGIYVYDDDVFIRPPNKDF